MTVGNWPPPPSIRGQQWELGDYQRLIRSGKTDGTGAGTITFPAVDAGRRLEITRATISCAGTISPLPSCRLYTPPAGQSAADQYEVSGTSSGLFDEADYPDTGLWVLEGEQLLVVWAGAPANAAITANLQARLMVRTD